VPLHAEARGHDLGEAALERRARDVEVRLLAIQEDKRSLEVLVSEEGGLLSYLMGLPTATEVAPMPVDMPVFETLQPLDYQDFEFRAVDASPEIRQFSHLMVAADYERRAAKWAFLGSNGMSRGVGGGIFDSLPVQDGLGFGTPASLRIVSAQKEILQAQQKGIEETLKRHLKLLVNNYNLDLENYANLKKRVELTSTTNEQLYERLRIGQDVAILDLIEASRNHIQADTAFFAVKFRFLTNEDKLARLIFYGDYSKQPVSIDELRKK
jgi:outer membrane protein TolC